MFTGLVQALGVVHSAVETAAGRRLTVGLGELAGAKIAMGDSVSVSGVCLTVTQVGEGKATFDVVTETLRRSTLGSKRVGDRVNLELSLRPDSFVGGHFVQGHVDTVGKVAGVQARAEDWRISVEVGEEVVPYIVPKGSVTIEGVSMTIAEVKGKVFEVAVIPTTRERTTLGGLGVGSGVNVETDILARTVVHYLQQLSAKGGLEGGGGLNMAKLIESGFA